MLKLSAENSAKQLYAKYLGIHRVELVVKEARIFRSTEQVLYISSSDNRFEWTV